MGKAQSRDSHGVSSTKTNRGGDADFRRSIARQTYRSDLERCVTGKFEKRPRSPGSPSAISVQEPNSLEIARIGKLVKTEHPLLHIVEPDSWKNIPLCLVDAFKALIKVLHDGDKQLFDFEVKTNERLYKLQRQLDQRKEKAATSEKQLTSDINKQINELKDKNDRELREHDNLIRICQMHLEGQKIVQESTAERLTDQLEALGKQLRKTGQSLKDVDRQLKGGIRDLEKNLMNRTQVPVGELEPDAEEEAPVHSPAEAEDTVEDKDEEGEVQAKAEEAGG